MTSLDLSAIRNYRQADDSIGTSGQPSVEQLSSIAAAGYKTVINLALHDDPRYSLADERATVEGLGMAYIHIPVQFADPTEADLLTFFSAFEAHAKEKVWIHCAANYRVTAFLGLHRVTRQGWQYAGAFELMNELWQPNEVWLAFIQTMLAKHGASVAD